MIRPAPFLLCLAAFGFSVARPASADTYTDYIVDTSSGSISNVGFTGDGRSLVLSLNTGCGLSVVPCYQTFTPPSGNALSTTEPTLTNGDGPGGYSTFTTGTGPLEDLYVSHDGMNTLIYSGNFGNVLINSFGDVAFLAYNSFNGITGDSNVLAVNDSAPGPVPEPSAFVLLGTGILGIVARYRHRSIA